MVRPVDRMKYRGERLSRADSISKGLRQGSTERESYLTKKFTTTSRPLSTAENKMRLKVPIASNLANAD